MFRWIGPLPLSEERDKSVGLTDKKCHPWLHLEIGKAKCRLALLPKQNLSIPQFSFPKFKWHAFVGIRFEDIVRCSWASSGIRGQCLGSFDLYSVWANQSSHMFLFQNFNSSGLTMINLKPMKASLPFGWKARWVHQSMTMQSVQQQLTCMTSIGEQLRPLLIV